MDKTTEFDAPSGVGVDAVVSQKYSGKDNYGRPKARYLGKISGMDDTTLSRECYNMIYHSARCANNPRADWHWMVDACYDEAKKRNTDANIYSKAFDRCYADHAG